MFSDDFIDFILQKTWNILSSNIGTTMQKIKTKQLSFAIKIEVGIRYDSQGNS